MLKDTHYNFTITKLVLFEHLIFVTVEILSLVIEGCVPLHAKFPKMFTYKNSEGHNGC